MNSSVRSSVCVGAHGIHARQDIRGSRSTTAYSSSASVSSSSLSRRWLPEIQVQHRLASGHAGGEDVAEQRDGIKVVVEQVLAHDPADARLL